MSPSIDEVSRQYQEHARTYYRKPNGRPTRTADNIADACRSFCEARLRWGEVKVRVGNLPAEKMTPQVLRSAQQAMAESGSLSRATINYRIKWIRSMFRWAALEGLVEDTLPHRLEIVPPLKRGRSKAPETEPVKPVPHETVFATIAQAPLRLATMIETQILTGMRPGELCQMRWSCIDRKVQPWVYQPLEHKNEHHDQDRLIPLGPVVQGLLERWEPRCRGRDELWKMQRLSYYRAIQRINRRSGIPDWTPNQIRHATATELRKTHGIEIARVVLGHKSLKMTEIYAETDLQSAMEAMKHFG